MACMQFMTYVAMSAGCSWLADIAHICRRGSSTQEVICNL